MASIIMHHSFIISKRSDKVKISGCLLDENLDTRTALKRLYKLSVDYRPKTKEGYIITLSKNTLKVTQIVNGHELGWLFEII